MRVRPSSTSERVSEWDWEWRVRAFYEYGFIELQIQLCLVTRCKAVRTNGFYNYITTYSKNSFHVRRRQRQRHASRHTRVSAHNKYKSRTRTRCMVAERAAGRLTGRQVPPAAARAACSSQSSNPTRLPSCRSAQSRVRPAAPQPPGSHSLSRICACAQRSSSHVRPRSLVARCACLPWRHASRAQSPEIIMRSKHL